MKRKASLICFFLMAEPYDQQGVCGSQGNSCSPVDSGPLSREISHVVISSICLLIRQCFLENLRTIAQWVETV